MALSALAGFASKGDPKTRHQFLSRFQKEKFAHMFHIWFVPYNMNVLERHNIPDWIERLRVCRKVRYSSLSYRQADIT